MTQAAQRLVRQQAIENRNETLVHLATTTAESVSAGIAEMERYNKRNPLGKSQFNNLLNISKETNSLDVVENWVRYQMGRDRIGRAWQDTQLGPGVTNAIDQIRTNARAIMTELYGAEEKDNERREIEIQLMRLYAGYLLRAYIARHGEKG